MRASFHHYSHGMLITENPLLALLMRRGDSTNHTPNAATLQCARTCLENGNRIHF